MITTDHKRSAAIESRSGRRTLWNRAFLEDDLLDALENERGVVGHGYGVVWGRKRTGLTIPFPVS
jgi:hypothetical protein